MRSEFQALTQTDNGSVFQVPFNSWNEWGVSVGSDRSVCWSVLVRADAGIVVDHYRRLGWPSQK